MIEIQEKDIRKVSAFRGKRVPFLFLRTEEIQDDGKRFFQTDAAGGRSIFRRNGFSAPLISCKTERM